MKVEIVKEVGEETILREVIRKVKRGGLVYTDKFRSYDGLVIYGFKHELTMGGGFQMGWYINGIEGFWSYAKERLLKFHGLSVKNFPFYLKELEFRYNKRDEDIFEELAYISRGGIK